MLSAEPIMSTSKASREIFLLKGRIVVSPMLEVSIRAWIRSAIDCVAPWDVEYVIRIFIFESRHSIC
jgi:hypothetical protein